MVEPDFNEKVGKALQEEVADEGVVIRWLAVAEVMDGEGDKRLVGMRGPNELLLPVWDVRGWMMTLSQDPGLFQSEEDD